MKNVYKFHVLPCSGPRCGASNGEQLKGLFKDMLPDRKVLGVRMSTTSCQGMCKRGPNVTIYPEGIVYHRVQPGDVERIVEEHLRGGQPIEELARRSLDDLPEMEEEDS